MASQGRRKKRRGSRVLGKGASTRPRVCTCVRACVCGRVRVVKRSLNVKVLNTRRDLDRNMKNKPRYALHIRSLRFHTHRNSLSLFSL